MERSISYVIAAIDRSSPVVDKIADKVNDLGDEIDKASGTVDIKVNDSELLGIFAKLERINAKKIKIDADIALAEQRLSDLEKMKEKATSEKDKLRIDADTTKAKAKLDALKRERIALDIDTRQAEVDIDKTNAKIAGAKKKAEEKTQLEIDSKKAQNEVGKYNEKIDDAKKKTREPINLDIKTDFNPGVIITGISAVIAALGGVVAVAGAAAGALAGIGAVGAVGIGAVTAGFGGISDALTAMDADAGAAASAVKASATDIKAAHASVKNAELDLRDAQIDEKRAQEDLTNARKDAERQLRDLALSTEDMSLRQRDATLSVREAEQRLTEVNKDSKSTSIDRARAELSLAEARQRVKEVDADASDLAAKKADADRKGIEGSDQVIAAQDRIGESHRRTEDSALKLEQAIQSLNNTLNPPQSGGGGIDALAKAMEDLGPKAREFVKFFKDFTDGPLLKLRQAGQEAFLPGIQSGLAKLGPTLASLQGPFASFSAVLGTAIGNALAGVTKMAAPFANFATSALNGLKPLEGVFSSFGKNLSGVMQQAAGDGTVNAAMGGLVQVASALSPVITQLVAAGLKAGAIMGPYLGRAFRDIGVALQPLFKAMPDLSKSFGELLVAITPLLPPITQMVAQLGPPMMQAFTQLAIAALPLVKMLADMATVLARHPELLNGVVAASAALGVAMGPLGSVIGVVASAIGAVSAPVLIAVGAIALLAAGIAYAYTHSETFRQKVSELWSALQGAFDQVRAAVIPAITQLGSTIRSTVIPAFSAFVEAMTPIITFLVQKLAPVVSAAFAGIIISIRGALTVISGVINVITGLISGDWSRSWEGIKQVVSGAWTVITNAFSVAKKVIGGYSSGMWDGIKNSFRAVLNWVIGAWNSMSFTIPAFDFAGVHTNAVKLSLGHIQPFADGGIVTQPTLGLVGEAGPEAIIPLSRARSVLQPQGAGGISIIVQASAVLSDKYAIAAAVTDALRTAVQRGMLPASVLA